MSRVSAAFRSFFSLLFSGVLPEDIALAFGFVKPTPPPPPVEIPKVSDGALQMLAILQRDGRLLDFLMEDIAGFDDEQIGAVVRTLHKDCKATIARHVGLQPVMDAVEGTFQKLDATKAPDASRIKLIGNVPANGRVGGGVLRHRGWRAATVELPALGKGDASVLAPAELEVE